MSDTFTIKDLGSVNGVFVERKKIAKKTEVKVREREERERAQKIVKGTRSKIF
jgi:pSer/pThr/pTyr-binding forkhead associated (FHA) protein